ncbi:hypothetical protein DsansV1_C31g0217681 [Dioscorea sansibarensis]
MAVAQVQKMVLITVYEVKPRRRRLSFSQNHHARRLSSNHHTGSAYNRRAELLQYCQQLRAHSHQTGTTSRATPIINVQATRLFLLIAIRVNTRNSRLGPENIGRGCCCQILF